MSGTPAPTVYAFEDGSLDLGRRELVVSSRLVELQPLVFDLFAYFLAHAGRVIGKDELLREVWGNAIGTDAVIARAVMKIRRAIGDDGQEPRYLKTVHRVGYRLDLAVEAVAAPEVVPQAQLRDEVFERTARGPALLRCVNATGEASLDWIEHGIPGLVQQIVGGHAPLTLAPVDADWTRPGEPPDDAVLARACDALGASEAVTAELHGSGDALQLHVRRGRDGSDVRRTDLAGASVADLAHGLAAALVAPSPAPKPAPATRGPSAFWEEQLARALDLDRKGQVDRALALMDECAARLPASPQLLLAHAAMLRRTGRRDLAGQKARAALASASGLRSAELLARAHFEMATQAWHDAQPAESARLCQQALAAAQEDPAAAAIIPDILAFYASISRESGNGIPSIHLAERAIAASIGLGSRAKEAHARVVLGSALLHAGQTHRAGDVLRRAEDLANRLGLVLTQAYALRTLALLDDQAGRYTLAIDEARRGAALAASCGHLPMRDSARVQEIVSLIRLGELAQAEAASERLQAGFDHAWENAYSLRYARAVLAWRRDADRAAAEATRAVADEGRRVGLRFGLVVRLEQCLQQVSLGDLAGAESALEDLRQADAEVAVLQARAALCLARGDRAGCMEQLHRAAHAAVADAADGVHIDVNLAWLLIEDAQWDEASALVGQIAEVQAEQLPARIVTSAYLLARNPQGLARGEWEALVRSSRRLSTCYPALLGPDFADQLRTGRLPRLPELLSRACW